MKLLRDQKAVEGLQEFIDSCASKEIPRSELHAVNNLHQQKRTRREMRLSVYGRKLKLLDLGFEANFVMWKTWELMGKPNLRWSPIQLRMENQQKIFPCRRLSGVTIDIEGDHTTIDFEVTEILDDNNPYPALLGLDWAFDNMAIINLNKRQKIFEGNNMRVIVPLYTELVREEYCTTDIDNIY